MPSRRRKQDDRDEEEDVAKDFLGLGSGDEDSDSEIEDGPQAEAVLALKEGGSDDDDDEDSEEDDDEGDDEGESDEGDSDNDQETSGRPRVAWGRDRRAYHDNDSDAEIDDEEAAAEAEEARAIRKAQVEAMDEADFDGESGDSDSEDDEDDEEEEEQDAAALLSKDDKLKLVMADAPELAGLLDQLGGAVRSVREDLAPLLARLKGQKAAADAAGISFLSTKYQLMLSYVSHIAFYLMLKAEGLPVRSHPVMERLVHIRALLERMRPLEQRLQRQIKAAATVKTAKAGSDGDGDDDNDDDDDDEQDEEEGKGGGEEEDEEQMAPNLAALGAQTTRRATAPADEDREAREQERLRRKQRSSRLFRDLRAQYTARPAEVGADGEGVDDDERAAARRRHAAEDKEREAFEEEHFARLNLSKAQKKERRKAAKRSSGWDALGDLDDFSGVADNEGLQALMEHERSRRSRTAEGAGAATTGKRGRWALESADPLTARSGGAGRKAKQIGGGALGGGAEEDALYMAAAKAADASKASKRLRREAKRAAAAAAAVASNADDDVDGKRAVGKAIMKNRGLVKYRKKEMRNPRVHARKKAEKAKKRQRGQRQKSRVGEAADYAGEQTGIRTNISRSRMIQ